jgi:hypothetical protein
MPANARLKSRRRAGKTGRGQIPEIAAGGNFRDLTPSSKTWPLRPRMPIRGYFFFLADFLALLFVDFVAFDFFTIGMCL